MNIKNRLVPAYEDAFYARFPIIFADVLEKKVKSVSPLTDWGIECGVGWRTLLESLFSELERMAAELPLSDRGCYRVTQVKQKYGFLRVYTPRATEEMRAAIGKAEDDSQRICESCGASGDLTVRRRWRRVECQDPGCPGKAE